MLYLSDELGLDPVLPELYAVLGEDKLVAFLKIFGGRTMSVPSVVSVREAYLSIRVWGELVKLKKSMSIKSAVKKIAVKFEISERQVLTRCRKVKAITKRLGDVLSG